MGIASGAGDIFGTTGGVMEATLRAASELVTGKPADRLEFTEVRAVEGLRETYVAIGEQNIHVGVANGLTNAKIAAGQGQGGQEPFHVIEVMACPGGCIGGGGQPYPPEGYHVLDPELLRKRASALYTIDSGKQLRKSYENPAIEEVYDSSSAGPARKRPTSFSTPTTRPDFREASDEPDRHAPATDNWEHVQAASREALGEPICAVHRRVPPRPPAGKPTHRRAAPSAGAVRVLEPGPSGRRGPTAASAGGQGGRRGQLLPFLPPAAPRGKFMINVCLGTACYVKGADRIARRVMGELGITWGETSKDGIFTPGSGPLPGHLRPGPSADGRRTRSTARSRPTRCRRSWKSISTRRGGRVRLRREEPLPARSPLIRPANISPTRQRGTCAAARVQRGRLPRAGASFRPSLASG